MSKRPAQADLRAPELSPSFGQDFESPQDALRRLPFFRGLTEEELAQVTDTAELVRIDQDRVIPRAGKGDEAPAYYFLMRGQVASRSSSAARCPNRPRTRSGASSR